MIYIFPVYYYKTNDEPELSNLIQKS
jgi:hypothetical protein